MRQTYRQTPPVSGSGMPKRLITARLETWQHRQAPQNQVARGKGIAQRKRRHALGRAALLCSADYNDDPPVCVLHCVSRMAGPGHRHQSFGALVHCTAASRTPKVTGFPAELPLRASDADDLLLPMLSLSQLRCPPSNSAAASATALSTRYRPSLTRGGLFFADHVCCLAYLPTLRRPTAVMGRKLT